MLRTLVAAAAALLPFTALPAQLVHWRPTNVITIDMSLASATWGGRPALVLWFDGPTQGRLDEPVVQFLAPLPPGLMRVRLDVAAALFMDPRPCAANAAIDLVQEGGHGPRTRIARMDQFGVASAGPFAMEHLGNTSATTPFSFWLENRACSLGRQAPEYVLLIAVPVFL